MKPCKKFSVTFNFQRPQRVSNTPRGVHPSNPSLPPNKINFINPQRKTDITLHAKQEGYESLKPDQRGDFEFRFIVKK